MMASIGFLVQPLQPFFILEVGLSTAPMVPETHCGMLRGSTEFQLHPTELHGQIGQPETRLELPMETICGLYLVRVVLNGQAMDLPGMFQQVLLLLKEMMQLGREQDGLWSVKAETILRIRVMEKYGPVQTSQPFPRLVDVYYGTEPSPSSADITQLEM
jgi:hypothetical protein